MSEKCPKCGGEVAMSEKFESGDTFPERLASVSARSDVNCTRLFA